MSNHLETTAAGIPAGRPSTTRPYAARTVVLATTALIGLAALPGTAEAQSRPGGCLKYGLGGAIAGHFAGGHRLKGALVGCAIGVYQRRQHEREANQRNRPRQERAPAPREADRGDGSLGPTAERPRPVPPRRTQDQAGRTQEQGGRYDDLGLDLPRERPTTRPPEPPTRQAERPSTRLPEQPTRQAERSREGYEPGGTFSRGQYGRDIPERSPRQPRLEPETTGSFLRNGIASD